MISDHLASAEQQFLGAERQVELDSAALKKELRLVDLVGIQMLNIVGLFWVGTAGKLGSSHVMFWMFGVLLFYIPSGIVVDDRVASPRWFHGVSGSARRRHRSPSRFRRFRW
jgi:hypothetical protein